VDAQEDSAGDGNQASEDHRACRRIADSPRTSTTMLMMLRTEPIGEVDVPMEPIEVDDPMEVVVEELE
jgi:hypothetical protein